MTSVRLFAFALIFLPGIDLATGAITFATLNVIGTGMVLVGFLILIIPNSVVTIELRTFKVRLRPRRKFVLPTEAGCDNLAMSEEAVEAIVFERAKV